MFLLILHKNITVTLNDFELLIYIDEKLVKVYSHGNQFHVIDHNLLELYTINYKDPLFVLYKIYDINSITGELKIIHSFKISKYDSMSFQVGGVGCYFLCLLLLTLILSPR